MPLDPAVWDRVLGKVDRYAEAKTDRLQDLHVELHQDAPRGGQNVNRFGLARSAPGEAPAIEEGTLERALLRDPEKLAHAHYRVRGNYEHLEFGTRTVAPRPLSRQAIAALKRESQ